MQFEKHVTRMPGAFELVNPAAETARLAIVGLPHPPECAIQNQLAGRDFGEAARGEAEPPAFGEPQPKQSEGRQQDKFGDKADYYQQSHQQEGQQHAARQRGGSHRYHADPRDGIYRAAALFAHPTAPPGIGLNIAGNIVGRNGGVMAFGQLRLGGTVARQALGARFAAAVVWRVAHGWAER